MENAFQMDLSENKGDTKIRKKSCSCHANQSFLGHNTVRPIVSELQDSPRFVGIILERSNLKNKTFLKKKGSE